MRRWLRVTMSPCISRRGGGAQTRDVALKEIGAAALFDNVGGANQLTRLRHTFPVHGGGVGDGRLGLI